VNTPVLWAYSVPGRDAYRNVTSGCGCCHNFSQEWQAKDFLTSLRISHFTGHLRVFRTEDSFLLKTLIFYTGLMCIS
jgi:hypothetical protein